MKGKNDSTPFLPSKVKTGGKVTYIQNKEAMCLTKRQVDNVYKAIEEDTMINDNVRYVQHDNMTSQNFNVNTLDYRDHKELYLKLKEVEREILDVDFGIYPYITKSRYLDVYDGVYTEMVYANKFNENSDLSTTFLGQIGMTRDNKIKVEEKFPITGQGFASGKLLDGMKCQILLNTGATKSYMSKLYYLHCKTLHALPKFSSNTQRIQVGNGPYVSVLFVIPVIVDVHGHRFEIFTLVSEIHDNVDPVMGMKNIFEFEGVIDSRDSCFSFLNRSIPFFPVMTVEIMPKSQKVVMIEAPFLDELSGMAMVKFLDMKEQTRNMIK